VIDLRLRSLHGNLRDGVVAAISHQERGLPRWDQAVGRVGP